MSHFEDPQIKKVLEEALWQVEEAKRLDLSISKAMNFINLSREAQGFGNVRLALGLLGKAKEQLFNDLINNTIGSLDDDKDVIGKMRLERAIREARERFEKGDLAGSYDLIISRKEVKGEGEKVDMEDVNVPNLYSEALDSLQKVWLKMKREEDTGKDMGKIQLLIKEARKALSERDYQKTIDLCNDIMDNIQSPKDRLREEALDTIEDITRTLKAIFPSEPRSPKERFFKNQIEELLMQSRRGIDSGSPILAINHSRKARELLDKLEQETIKGDIPRLIIELRSEIDDLKASKVDVSYEDYLLKQVEDTFWKGEYIKARKIANKLSAITNNAGKHLKMNQLSSLLNELDMKMKNMAGKEGYLQAKEYVEKARRLMDQSAFDMALSFLNKASNVLNT